MKILHISDLHLGKRLHGVERLDAQRAVMDGIVAIAKERKIGLTVIAGDVFDTPMPSSDAENLFYDTVERLGDVCTVLVISGNHDDASRLMAARALAARHNIVICGSFDTPPTACRQTVASGNNWMQLDINGTRVNAVLFPYPSDAAMGGEIREGESYTDRVGARLAAAAEACYGEGFNLLVAHLFCSGAVKSGSERDIELGTARVVPLDRLPKSHYIALGHIHKKLEIADGIWYSGAPMPYSFDEVEKKFAIIVDTDGGEPESVEIKQADCLMRGTFDSVEEGVAFCKENADALIDLKLRLPRAITVEENRALKACKSLVNLNLELTAEDAAQSAVRREEQSPEELFRAYCEHCQVEATDELMALFADLMQGGDA